jgi:putative multiple sugar transport system substrate-binding protein
LTGLVTVGLALALAGCGSSSDADTTKGVDANMGATIGIAMPTKVSTRWIADGKSMVEQFTEMGYKVNLQYADNNVKNQVAQVQSMINEGDKLLVIAAVDGSSLDSVLASATAKKFMNERLA